MRAIIIGSGEVGQHIARTLSAERHDVTVIDQDAARVEALQGELDALVVAGNGASPRFLREMGAEGAGLLCAVTRTDEVNVIAALAGHQLGARRTVARVRDPDYFGTDESFARDVLGIDFVISPERATAANLAEAILLPGAVHVEHFGEGRIAAAELILTGRSPVLDRPLQDRKMVRPHAVFGLIRDGRAIAAEPFHRPHAGDHLLVAADREDIGPVVAQLAGHTQKVRHVVIFGAGRVGLPLARLLVAAGRFRVTLMESDAERARFVAERIEGATVLHEEGVGLDALTLNGVDTAGAFVACAGDDRANLLAALNAKRLGAGVCLAVVSREEFTPLVDALGIDAAFSPRLVTAEAILRSVRGDNVQAMHLMMGGAEVLEVEVDSGCKAEGRTASATAMMAGSRLVAILRNDRVVIPSPDETVRGGDRVLLFNSVKGVADVQRTFNAA